MRRIDKIRKHALHLLIETGSDILFIAETPDMELGKGECIDCARRLMNELKHRYKKLGIKFDYQLVKEEK